jgi:hypothetical protein
MVPLAKYPVPPSLGYSKEPHISPDMLLILNFTWVGHGMPKRWIVPHHVPIRLSSMRFGLPSVRGVWKKVWSLSVAKTRDGQKDRTHMMIRHQYNFLRLSRFGLSIHIVPGLRSLFRLARLRFCLKIYFLNLFYQPLEPEAVEVIVLFFS